MIPGLKLGLGLVGAVAVSLLGIAMFSNFEMPGRQVSIQRGFRGVAMETNYNPVQLAKYVAENKVPASLPQLPATGPKAGQVYKNVLVLGELSVGQFTRLMVSITNWVSPKQGCAYCHNTNNMAEDTYYTKIVARRMLQMTQNINANWAPHVAPAGVTCYTCHRGNNVPNYIWWKDEGPTPNKGGVLEVSMGQNRAAASVGDSSLPYDPFTPMLEGDYPIRQQGETALPNGNRHSIKETEWTYALMIHFAQSLGVNCTYCHNSRAFGDWSQSTPQRVTAWHGIRMVRDINTRVHGPAAKCVPGQPAGHVRRLAQGGLRHLPPGRVQAAVWREHGRCLPGAEGGGAAGRPDPDQPHGREPGGLSSRGTGDAADEAYPDQLAAPFRQKGLVHGPGPFLMRARQLDRHATFPTL